MQEAENDIALVTQDYMYSAAFQGTPLAKSVLGTTESLRYFADCLVFCMLRMSENWPFVAMCHRIAADLLP